MTPNQSAYATILVRLGVPLDQATFLAQAQSPTAREETLRTLIRLRALAGDRDGARLPR
jgi:hypothetical protein